MLKKDGFTLTESPIYTIVDTDVTYEATALTIFQAPIYINSDPNLK
jgi:hypothetical protein